MTLALNLFSHGVDPELNFENVIEIMETYERLTKMKVHERHPYAGKLVFTAFSGSHQDAITKGFKWREEKENEPWKVPYLVIDPKDIGREYEGDIIRINSQSGKGGIGYLLEQQFGFDLPPKMRESFGYAVKNVSDHENKELMPSEIYDIFINGYVNITDPIQFIKSQTAKNENYDTIVTVQFEGKVHEIPGAGNGRLDAVSNALQTKFGLEFSDLEYKQHAQEVGSKSNAVSYIGIKDQNGNVHWGCGIDTDIMTSSIRALFSAVNSLVKTHKSVEAVV